MTPLVDRVLNFLENSNAGNDFRDYYEIAKGTMDTDEIDSRYDVSITNHSFLSFENRGLEKFRNNKGFELPEELETIEEKEGIHKRRFEGFSEVIVCFITYDKSFNLIFFRQKLKSYFRIKTSMYLLTRFLELQSIM